MLASWPGSRLAAAGLVVANLIPLAGAIWLGWQLHTILVVYWLESAVVGVEAVAKILHAEGEDDPDELPSIEFNDRPVEGFIGRSNGSVAAFFTFHYGVFWSVHGVFVWVFPATFPAMGWASPRSVAYALVGLAAYHLVSYRRNYIGQGEHQRTGPVTQMVEPYRRVFVLHLTVILGAFAIGAIGAPVGALAVMVLTKTVLDLWGHWREHDRAHRRAPPATVA